MTFKLTPNEVATAISEYLRRKAISLKDRCVVRFTCRNNAIQYVEADFMPEPAKRVADG